MKTKRISTTIPGDLKDELQLRASQAGISVSRLVYLILIRKKKTFAHRSKRHKARNCPIKSFVLTDKEGWHHS